MPIHTLAEYKNDNSKGNSHHNSAEKKKGQQEQQKAAFSTSKGPLLPPRDLSKFTANAPLFVFDLDHTLLHASSQMFPSVLLRPHLSELIETLRELGAETALWTAGNHGHVQHCVKRGPMPEAFYDHVLAREDWFLRRESTTDGTNFSDYAKAHQWLGRDQNTVILVENSPSSCHLNATNSILVSDFDPLKPSDVKEDRTLSILASEIVPFVCAEMKEKNATAQAALAAAPALERCNVCVSYVRLPSRAKDRKNVDFLRVKYSPTIDAPRATRSGLGTSAKPSGGAATPAFSGKGQRLGGDGEATALVAQDPSAMRALMLAAVQRRMELQKMADKEDRGDAEDVDDDSFDWESGERLSPMRRERTPSDDDGGDAS